MGAVEKPRTDVAAPAAWDYAPAPEAREIVAFEKRYGLFIGGEQVSPRSRSWFTTISPSSEEPLAEVAQGGQKDVALAVDAARDAFSAWSRTPTACHHAARVPNTACSSANSSVRSGR